MLTEYNSPSTEAAKLINIPGITTPSNVAFPVAISIVYKLVLAPS